jgi:DNA-binding transcriptional regulator YdaS (Cro superfamily)
MTRRVLGVPGGLSPSLTAALVHCGSRARLALSCGVPRSLVGYWISVGRIPRSSALCVELATGGVVGMADVLADCPGKVRVVG